MVQKEVLGNFDVESTGVRWSPPEYVGECKVLNCRYTIHCCMNMRTLLRSPVNGVGRLRGISLTLFVFLTIFLSSLKGLTGLEGPPIKLSSDAIVLSGSSCH